MPSYMCGAITIKLSAADLQKSTSRSLINQHGKEQFSHYQSIENELRTSLQERPFAEHPLYMDDGQPSHLRFLGAHQDMPFLIVKAGRSLNTSNNLNTDCASISNQLAAEITNNEAKFLPVVKTDSFAGLTIADDGNLDDQTSLLSAVKEDETLNQQQESTTSDTEKYIVTDESINLDPHSNNPSHDEVLSLVQSKRHTSSFCSDLTANRYQTTVQDLKPQALCLTVQLSKKSFLPNPYPHIKKLRALDIKIDIYYNGELCTSCYVPERLRSGSSIAELTQRFGGRRVDRLLERPWIVVPHGQNSDGSPREHRCGKGDGTSAHQRWKAVSDILKGEVEKGGRNEWGDPSILGDYLESLSKLEMPKEVEDLQKGSEVKYGIIDVVLTAGHGKKDNADTGYLSQPSRMRVSSLRETSVETKVKLPKSSIPQNDHPLATPTAKQRAKVFADAEIIQSGFSSLAPRRQASISSCITVQQPSAAPAPSSLSQHGGLFQVPTTPSTAPMAARCRQSGSGQAAKVHTNPASMRVLVDRPASLQLHKIPRPRPSYHGSGPAFDPALGNRSKEKEPKVTRSTWTEFFSKRRERSVSPTSLQRGGDYAITIAKSGTHTKNDTNASRQRRQVSQGVSRRTSRASISAISKKPKDTAQKRYKGSDSETQEDAREMQKEQRDKMQTGFTNIITTKLTINEDIEAMRQGAMKAYGQAKKKTRMGYIHVLTNKLTEAETIEAIRRKAIDDFAARDVQKNKDTPESSIYISPVTRCRRSSNQPPAPSVTLPSSIAEHRTPAAPGPSQSQPPKRSRSPSQNRPGPLILSLSPNLLSTVGTRPNTPAPHASHTSPHNSPSLSPLSSLVAVSPEVPESFPNLDHRRVASVTLKPSKPSSSTVTSASPSIVQWQPSAMNEDCVITYAPDKLRQVKSERTGWFKEASLLCGVRFVVV